MNHNKYIQRDSYLNKLIIRKDNGEVKIITGPRRCGKSWLLSHIYRDYLTGHGVPSEISLLWILTRTMTNMISTFLIRKL